MEALHALPTGSRCTGTGPRARKRLWQHPFPALIVRGHSGVKGYAAIVPSILPAALQEQAHARRTRL